MPATAGACGRDLAATEPGRRDREHTPDVDVPMSEVQTVPQWSPISETGVPVVHDAGHLPTA
jgi:hypothetical protein